jgi:DNA polymerase-3 subunit gamma/tau
VLGAGATERVLALLDALAAGDAAGGLNAINAAIDEGADARQLARQIVEALRGLLLIKLGDAAQVNAPSEQRARMEQQANRLDLDRIIRATKLFNQAASELKTGWQPQLPLELAYIDALSRVIEVVPPARPKPSPVATQPAPKPPAPTKSGPAAAPATAQPPADPKVTAPAPAAKPPANLDLRAISAQWPAILAELKTRSVQTWGLMNSCQLAGAEGDAVVLQWPSAMLRDKFEKGKDKRLVEDVIGGVVGYPVRTRCVVDDDPVVQEAKRLGAQVRPVTNR